MSDLVERLRTPTAEHELCGEAADRIEELEKSVNTFRKAYSKQKRQKVALRVELQQRIDEMEAQVKELEAALRHIAEGTWWDGNEPWAFHRVESYALAALQENNDESKEE